MRNALLLIAVACATANLFGETLKGTVKDSSGTPISGAMALVHWDSAGTPGLKSNIGIQTDLSLRTKDDGTFSVDLPAGFYDVFVAAMAFTPTCRKIRVKVGRGQEVNFTVIPDPLYTAEMGNRTESLPPKRRKSAH